MQNEVNVVHKEGLDWVENSDNKVVERKENVLNVRKDDWTETIGTYLQVNVIKTRKVTGNKVKVFDVHKIKKVQDKTFGRVIEKMDSNIVDIPLVQGIIKGIKEDTNTETKGDEITVNKNVNVNNKDNSIHHHINNGMDAVMVNKVIGFPIL